MFIKFYNENKCLIITICFAIVLRLLFFFSIKPWDEQVVKNRILIDDAIGYHNLALDILEDVSFSSFSSTQRTPGYPFFVAIIYSLFGVLPWVVLFVQLCLIPSLYLQQG